MEKYDDLKGRDDVTNITAAYDNLFNYNMYIYFAFDLMLTIGLIQGYLYRRISEKEKKHFLFILCTLLFVFYIVFGGLLLLSAFIIRCSDAGQVCSGDFLKKGDVFSDGMIDAYIELKMQEVVAVDMAPHPLEFDMYYSG